MLVFRRQSEDVSSESRFSGYLRRLNEIEARADRNQLELLRIMSDARNDFVEGKLNDLRYNAIQYTITRLVHECYGEHSELYLVMVYYIFRFLESRKIDYPWVWGQVEVDVEYAAEHSYMTQEECDAIKAYISKVYENTDYPQRDSLSFEDTRHITNLTYLELRILVYTKFCDTAELEPKKRMELFVQLESLCEAGKIEQQHVAELKEMITKELFRI